MMEWYIPITILPGLGMLILSTTSQMMTLSAEIGNLLKEQCTDFEHHISALKIKQLGKLTRACALLYVAAACFVLSGVIDGILPDMQQIDVPNIVLYLGVVLMLISLALLILYGFNTISIRKLQHQYHFEMSEGEKKELTNKDKIVT